MHQISPETGSCSDECPRCCQAYFGTAMTHCLEPSDFWLMMACDEICRSMAAGPRTARQGSRRRDVGLRPGLQDVPAIGSAPEKQRSRSPGGGSDWTRAAVAGEGRPATRPEQDDVVSVILDAGDLHSR